MLLKDLHDEVRLAIQHGLPLPAAAPHSLITRVRRQLWVEHYWEELAPIRRAIVAERRTCRAQRNALEALRDAATALTNMPPGIVSILHTLDNATLNQEGERATFVDSQ